MGALLHATDAGKQPNRCPRRESTELDWPSIVHGLRSLSMHFVRRYRPPLRGRRQQRVRPARKTTSCAVTLVLASPCPPGAACTQLFAAVTFRTVLVPALFVIGVDLASGAHPTKGIGLQTLYLCQLLQRRGQASANADELGAILSSSTGRAYSSKFMNPKGIRREPEPGLAMGSCSSTFDKMDTLYTASRVIYMFGRIPWGDKIQLNSG
jgi:hypothetical protein